MRDSQYYQGRRDWGLIDPAFFPSNKAPLRQPTAFVGKMIDKKEIRMEYDQANAHMSDGGKYGPAQACV